jgi:hypothetical protein
MFQELDQFTFSGNSEEVHTKYGLAAWANIVLVCECKGVDTVYKFNKPKSLVPFATYNRVLPPIDKSLWW